MLLYTYIYIYIYKSLFLCMKTNHRENTKIYVLNKLCIHKKHELISNYKYVGHIRMSYIHFTFFGFRTANCAYKAIGRPYIY